MFQPQPTPFASSSFASYGLAPELDLGYPVSAGGGGAGAPPGSPYDSQPQQQQQQQPGAPLQNPHLQRQQQASASPAASPYAQSTASYTQSTTSTTSPPPQTPTNRDTAQAHHHQHQDLQLRQQQQQFQQLNNQPLHHTSQHQHHQAPQAPRQPYPSNFVNIPTMEDQQDQQGQHDMAAQQAAAKDYQAVHEGPLVGNKVSSDAITAEYAKADQVYVEKTIKGGSGPDAKPTPFPQTRLRSPAARCFVSPCRPCLGTLSQVTCRILANGFVSAAIGFSYFEKLIDSGDQGKIEGEVARLMSMNHMMSNVGGYAYFEEWADEMFGLLREIAQSMDSPDPQVPHLLLLERWNDAAVSSSIIYYLRLLAATYLKANAATYDPFLPEVAGGVVGYCNQSIELVDREIEHLGIVALVHMLLQPVNFVLEIVYLDRSPGSQANRYRFPEEANGQDPSNLGPIIYLLYRPDHYDILYLTPPPLAIPLPVPTAPVSMHVNRVNHLSRHTPITSTMDLGEYSSVDFSTLSIIPGLNSMGMAPLAPPPPTTSAQQQNSWISSYDGLPASSPQTQSQPAPALMASPQPPSPPTSMSASSSVGPNPPMVATSGLGPALLPPPNNRTTPGYQIRFSPVQLEYEENRTGIEPHFNVKTNTFKNSIWNRAHYGNPDFHPEEWSPDDEHVDGRVGGKRKMKKEPPS
ncbi:Ubiquitin thioesterase otubain-like protein [Ilyonectria robusta]